MKRTWAGATVGLISNLEPEGECYIGTCACGNKARFTRRAILKGHRAGILACKECASDRNDFAGPYGCRFCSGQSHRAMKPECPNCGTKHASLPPARAIEYAWQRRERVFLGTPD